MKVTPVKTHKITGPAQTIEAILDRYLWRIPEGSVVAVTSKIVSLAEGRMIPFKSKEEKDEVIIREAERYLPRSSSKYNVLLTIKGGGLIFSSGVDESNSAGFLTLWPKDPQQSANRIRAHLAKSRGLENVGVVITDTTSIPLRWGQRGVFVLAHSGFGALNSYIGKPDLFGKKMQMTSASVADALGTAAVLVMGEGAEQTPLALIEDLPFVRFQKRNPTAKELEKLRMPLQDDLFGPLLQAVSWKKGGAAQ